MHILLTTSVKSLCYWHPSTVRMMCVSWCLQVTQHQVDKSSQPLEGEEGELVLLQGQASSSLHFQVSKQLASDAAAAILFSALAASRQHHLLHISSPSILLSIHFLSLGWLRLEGWYSLFSCNTSKTQILKSFFCSCISEWNSSLVIMISSRKRLWSSKGY